MSIRPKTPITPIAIMMGNNTGNFRENGYIRNNGYVQIGTGKTYPAGASIRGTFIYPLEV